MRIVQINCSASGSTGGIAKAIHRRLLEQGHESYIFYEVGTPTEKNMFRIGNCFDLHVHSVLSRNVGKQGYFSLFPTARLVSKLRKLKPDVVHLHNLHGNYLQLPLLFRYLKKADCKVVVTLHDCWLLTGKCPHFTVVGCDKWRQHCGDCPQLSTYPRSKVDTTRKCLRDKKEWLSGFGDRMQIVTVSNWLKGIADQTYIAEYPIRTIYNGIDSSVFTSMDGERVREKYALENRFLILGVSSNWNEGKGLGSFLRLAEQLSEEEIILLVGVTVEQQKTLPKNVIGIAKTENRQELAALYSAADVFVNPSKEESFGLVTAEAMACGTPVIVYDSTACAELVDSEVGYVIRKDSELYSQIQIAKKNGKNQGRIFSDREMADGYLQLYMEKKNDESSENR